MAADGVLGVGLFDGVGVALGLFVFLRPGAASRHDDGPRGRVDDVDADRPDSPGRIDMSVYLAYVLLQGVSGRRIQR
ncbi:hypothetical protein Misp01_41090 [Microtetraspora sp. NBRC 13810]|nr:hypothetical protein Misp01_41090 [Microtetraspora sp. NBRC 13810]